MSQSVPSAAATRRVSPTSRLTPRLMFPARMIGAWRAAAAMARRSSAESPVVPITWTARACAVSSANATVAAGLVKSITACARAIVAIGSSLTVTPSSAPPSAAPRSRPTQSCPGRSSAPTSRQASDASTSRTSIRPIRPETPVMTIPGVWAPGVWVPGVSMRALRPDFPDAYPVASRPATP